MVNNDIDSSYIDEYLVRVRMYIRIHHSLHKNYLSNEEFANKRHGSSSTCLVKMTMILRLINKRPPATTPR